MYDLVHQPVLGLGYLAEAEWHIDELIERSPWNCEHSLIFDVPSTEIYQNASFRSRLVMNPDQR